MVNNANGSAGVGVGGVCVCGVRNRVCEGGVGGVCVWREDQGVWERCVCV